MNKRSKTEDEYPGDMCFDCLRAESIDKYWELKTIKLIRVTSCKNYPNIRKGVTMKYCDLNGSQNKLSSDYSIPAWCPLDDEVEE